jgi:pterin-4a-carbinolamine dehydratase/ribonuclease HI
MWKEDKNKLSQLFEFKDFNEAMAFVNKVAEFAEKLNHHPKITVDYNKVSLELTTHDKGDKVTEKDKELAEMIDNIQTKLDVSYDELTMYGDGGSRGNPGPAASGYVLYDKNMKELARGGRYLGETTNNQAEYDSLKQGLLHMAKLGASKINVFMDSQLVIRQMKGEYKVKNEAILVVYREIKDKILPKFKKIEFTHVPRELNKEADAEVNRILDSL